LVARSVQGGCLWDIAYRDKKVVSVFVRFRALHSEDTVKWVVKEDLQVYS
jgi:hypothetical protein